MIITSEVGLIDLDHNSICNTEWIETGVFILRYGYHITPTIDSPNTY